MTGSCQPPTSGRMRDHVASLRHIKVSEGRDSHLRPDLSPGLCRITDAMAGGPILLSGGQPRIDLALEDFAPGAPPVPFGTDESRDQNLRPRGHEPCGFLIALPGSIGNPGATEAPRGPSRHLKADPAPPEAWRSRTADVSAHGRAPLPWPGTPRDETCLSPAR